MFTAALFTKARTWDLPKYPSADKWIKIGYIYTMEYYSTIKRNEIESFVDMWVDLDSFIQRDISEKGKKQTSYIDTCMWNLEKWY